MKLLTLTIFSLVTFASHAAQATSPTCKEEAMRYAYKEANNIFGEESKETRSVCGARLLAQGDHILTFVVGISDEVEPSEFIVILNKADCKKKFITLNKDSGSRFEYSDKCKKF